MDRTQLIQILDNRIHNREIRNLVAKLLLPQRIELPGGRYFWQEKGVPQGLATSPILFVVYLDAILRKLGLLDHHILAYADDIVFLAQSKTELCSIINKLRRGDNLIQINEKKSGILAVGGDLLSKSETFMGIPIVSQYKYLGTWI